MLFSVHKHYLDTDTAQKVSQSVYRFTTSLSYGVENYFPRLWGTGISDAILNSYSNLYLLHMLGTENWPAKKLASEKLWRGHFRSTSPDSHVYTISFEF